MHPPTPRTGAVSGSLIPRESPVRARGDGRRAASGRGAHAARAEGRDARAARRRAERACTRVHPKLWWPRLPEGDDPRLGRAAEHGLRADTTVLARVAAREVLDLLRATRDGAREAPPLRIPGAGAPHHACARARTHPAGARRPAARGRAGSNARAWAQVIHSGEPSDVPAGTAWSKYLHLIQTMGVMTIPAGRHHARVRPRRALTACAPVLSRGAQASISR